jgi:hypothetical protein
MAKPVCFIVGAGDFIGAAITRRFIPGGYTVCAARRNGEKSDSLVAEKNVDGGNAVSFSMDARKEIQVVEKFAQIESEIGPMDVMISNAGGNVNFPIVETTEQVFCKVWRMACFTGFLAGREAAKHMLPRSKGSIFFAGATTSVRGGAGYAAFASAKFGLRALAQSMARKLGP